MRPVDRLLSLLEGVAIALDAMRANKVRAGLTILGIAVGVFVVTVMSAAVHGINGGVTKAIAAAGPTTFFVTKWPGELVSCNGSADSCPWRRFPPLTIGQAERVAALPSVKLVVSQVGSSSPVRYADRDLPSIGVSAYTPGWLEVEAGALVDGRDFTSAENDAAAPVALVNPKLAERLFAGGDAVGKVIRVSGQQFTVIGVFEPIATAFDSGEKGRLYVPFETARRRLDVGVAWMQMTVKPREGVARDEALDEVLSLLRAERHLRPAQPNDFHISTPEKILEMYNKVVGAFFLVMIVLSAVGLIVGGVGVVAIMMISVTERTREIGVRKALGATRATILWQFLVEAATLTGIGAVIGLVLGAGLSAVIRSLTPIEAAVPPTAVVAALAASALTGILFGMLPAVRAARLDPVDALRYE
ncbi:ABC transporter permease [Roseisolibacter sp. H3M3-2]|uniref:ABC transporter permease n=1 Tax=Roseisolibacter sp. H3M3-2 TaxID=3031323 RepID=UPI0023DBC248|nr:ABC transporter permease [Roseisolibacter sp. H3M3-2]MDF1502666.1 ABC transporter permease [Roseisolibacter sp. H3M3-2]